MWYDAAGEVFPMPDENPGLTAAAVRVAECLEAILVRIDLVIAAIPANMMKWDRIKRSLVHPGKDD